MKSVYVVLCAALLLGRASCRRSREVTSTVDAKVVHQIKMALLTTSERMNPDQMKVSQSFIQSSEGGPVSLGEVNGILQNMLDNYKSDLAEAIEKEDTGKSTNDKYQADLTTEFSELDSTLSKKQGVLADNDDEMSNKRTILLNSKKSLDDTETSLATLKGSCATTSEEYDTQKGIRMKEDEAITSAIAILDSDAAFQTFDKNVKKDIALTEESSSPSFLQTEKPHATLANLKHKVQRLQRMRSNPFAPVIDLLNRNIERIGREANQDFRIITKCNADETKNNGDRDTARQQKSVIELEISNLKSEINDEPDGLKPEVAKLLKDLDTNADDKAKAIKLFSQNMGALMNDISGKTDAVGLIDKALKVLGGFYDNYLQQSISLVQIKKEDPAFEGQQESGNGAISTLGDIKTTTQEGIEADHDSMVSKQASLEDDLTELQSAKEHLQTSLTEERATLATKLDDLTEARENLDLKIQEIEAINASAAAIKPKCDFFHKNEDKRNSSRVLELDELNFAITQLTNTEEYKKEEEKLMRKKLGVCAKKCMDPDPDLSEVNVAACEACKKQVPIAKFCATNNSEATGCAGLDLSFMQHHGMSVSFLEVSRAAQRRLEVDRVYANLSHSLAQHRAARIKDEIFATKNPITGVVEILQDMLEKSKEQGEALRETYAKDMCACNSGTEEKTTKIRELKDTIVSVSARIEHLRADTKELSQDCAQLTQDKSDNEKARSDANEERKKAHKEYTELKASLEAGIASMKSAEASLAGVGGDQTAGTSKDHEKNMAGFD